MEFPSVCLVNFVFYPTILRLIQFPLPPEQRVTVNSKWYDSDDIQSHRYGIF
jgi:hypothetical protein